MPMTDIELQDDLDWYRRCTLTGASELDRQRAWAQYHGTQVAMSRYGVVRLNTRAEPTSRRAIITTVGAIMLVTVVVAMAAALGY